MLDVIKRHLVSAAASLRPPENNDGWLPGDIGSLLSAPLAGLVLPCFRPGHTKKTHFSDTFFRRHRREVFFPFLIRIYIFSYFQSDDNNWKNELLELTAKKASSRFFFSQARDSSPPLSARLRKVLQTRRKELRPRRLFSRFAAKRRVVRRGSGAAFPSVILS